MTLVIRGAAKKRSGGSVALVGRSAPADLLLHLNDLKGESFWKKFSKTAADRYWTLLVGMSPVARHDLVKFGVPSSVVRDTLKTYHFLDHEMLLVAIGLSGKTLERREKDRLNERHSDAALALMEITALAENALGDRDLAEEWLNKPAIGLDGKKPLDMLTTAPGIAAVKELLGRIEYGVYA